MNRASLNEVVAPICPISDSDGLLVLY